MSRMSKREKQAQRRLLETLNWCVAAEHSLRTALAFPHRRSYWEAQGLRQLEGALKGRARHAVRAGASQGGGR